MEKEFQVYANDKRTDDDGKLYGDTGGCNQSLEGGGRILNGYCKTCAEGEREEKTTREINHDDHILILQYLTKQNVALREVNDSRVKIYEQLEESIAELEATNRALNDEAGKDKAKIRG